MASREKVDFVGAFCDTPVTGLSWGSFFNLAPSVKKGICHLLVQEQEKKEREKEKGRQKRSQLIWKGKKQQKQEPFRQSRVIETSEKS